MSRTWDLDVAAVARDPAARVRFSEIHLDLNLEIEIPGVASVQCYLDDDEARTIRDWLSWYLDEGPEPGVTS